MKKPEITKYCTHCGDKFTASRPTATFCSNTCRTKACVQRKQDGREKADQESQRLLELERLQQIADARRLKREQKAELKRQEQEKQNEIERQAKEAKRIQDEQDAADLAEKNRKEEEDLQQLKDKQEADKKQSLADKEAKRKIERDQKAKENQASADRALAWGLLLGHVVINISGMINNSQNNQPNPATPIKPIEKLMLGNAFSPFPKLTATPAPKPEEMPKLGYMSLPGINWMPKDNRPQ